MYTEGYVTKVTATDVTHLTPSAKKRPNKKYLRLSFVLEPAAPYQIKHGSGDGVLVLKDRISENTITGDQKKDYDAKLRFPKQLELSCPIESMDLSSLITLKTTHTRIGVGFADESSNCILTNLTVL